MNKFSLLLLSFILLVLSSCTLNHARINNDLKKYFDSSRVEGCFALLNNQIGNITVYNMTLDTQRLPAGTSFKIPETLIGIQTGKIVNENSALDNDSSVKNHLTLKQAFASSSVPYFQSLEREIGKDTMKFWLDSLGYGNKKITVRPDSFWINEEPQISPDEQLGLMSKLYFDQLPFQKYAQEMVSTMMLQEDNPLYKFSYTTGSGLDKINHQFAWNLGWIEENRHIYFFVTFIKTPDSSMDVKARSINISKSILKALGFFKGEK